MCHEIFEAAARGELGDGGTDFDGRFVARWDAAAREQVQQAVAQPVEASWGPIEKWPTYALKRSRVRARARELARQVADWPDPDLQIEQELRPPGERLYGRPDLVVRRPPPCRVIDYKTGAVTDDTGEIKPGYRQQLLLYAYLESKMPDGGMPEVAIVVPLKGEPVEVLIDWTEVADVVTEAHDLIERFNAHLDDPRALAASALDPCVQCQHVATCPEFWPRVTEQSPIQAIDGIVTEAHRAEQRAVTLIVDVASGSIAPGLVRLDRLALDQHPSLASVGVGDRIRIVGLRVLDDERRTARGQGWTRLAIQHCAQNETRTDGEAATWPS